jgi:phosphoglycerol transferase MdoB-like AlkP superfamily enzyme
MWAFELCLLIWYAAGISGYYAILSLGAITYIIYFTQVSQAREMLTTWYTAAFNIVNLVILLPVFHLDYFKAVQDPPEHVEYTEELSIPSIEH